jgi:hypothetical protein
VNDSADKEQEQPQDKHECPENENGQQGSAHGRNAPGDQDDDNGCI